MSCEGIFATSREHAPDGTVLVMVDRADPVTHISSTVLRVFATPSTDPRVFTELTPGRSADDYTGAVLKIHCDDRTVIYRITGPCEHDCWRMQFPD